MLFNVLLSTYYSNQVISHCIDAYFLLTRSNNSKISVANNENDFVIPYQQTPHHQQAGIRTVGGASEKPLPPLPCNGILYYMLQKRIMMMESTHFTSRFHHSRNLCFIAVPITPTLSPPLVLIWDPDRFIWQYRHMGKVPLWVLFRLPRFVAFTRPERSKVNVFIRTGSTS